MTHYTTNHACCHIRFYSILILFSFINPFSLIFYFSIVFWIFFCFVLCSKPSWTRQQSFLFFSAVCCSFVLFNSLFEWAQENTLKQLSCTTQVVTRHRPAGQLNACSFNRDGMLCTKLARKVWFVASHSSLTTFSNSSAVRGNEMQHETSSQTIDSR